jgi:copper chaperone NosL
MRPTFLLLAACAVAACAAPGPAPLDTRSESCSFCRMAVSDPRFAAQLVAPSEEPRFFDDVGCLASYLRAKRELPKGARAYVADHRHQAWIDAATAVYARVETLETPMGSHIVAHADAASRAEDAEAKDGKPLTAADVFGPSGPPGRTP